MISQFKEAYDNRHSIARKWKKEGKKVFGYVYSFVPEEIIYAAGIMPVQLTATEERGATGKGETLVPEYFCDYVHNCLGQGTDGIYHYLDGLIVPDACVPLRTLAEIWDVNVKTPFIYFLNYPSEADDGSRAFLTTEFSRLQKAIEKFTQTKISSAALRSAIEVYNENRNLLKKLYELRQRENSPISGSDVFEVFKAGLVMPKAEHNRMLKELLAQISAQIRKTTVKARIFVSAPIFEECSFVRPNFIKIVEEMGGEVVADDLVIGFRYYWEPVQTDHNLIKSLVDRYLGKVPIAYKMPDGVRAELFLHEALKHRVNGAIFFLPKYCESSLFQVPHLEERFREKGIATLSIESTSEMPEAPVKTRVQAFLEML